MVGEEIWLLFTIPVTLQWLLEGYGYWLQLVTLQFGWWRDMVTGYNWLLYSMVGGGIWLLVTTGYSTIVGWLVGRIWFGGTTSSPPQLSHIL